jgi:RES domain-containing protein
VRSMWRISGHGDLSGLGGERADGRWHTAAQGRRIVYFAEHPAVSLIETIVNLKGKPEFFPAMYRLMKVAIADHVSTSALAPDVLSEEWRENHNKTRSIGDGWLASGESALLAVPSAPSPESTNYLFNPLHFDATGVTVEWHKQIRYDERLFKVRDGSFDGPG